MNRWHGIAGIWFFGALWHGCFLAFTDSLPSMIFGPLSLVIGWIVVWAADSEARP